MKPTFKMSTAMLMVIVCSVGNSMQDKPYQKKVVSYVNIVLSPSSFGLSQQHKNYIAKQLANKINYERFTYAPLPPSIIKQFSDQALGKTSYTAENVRPLIDQTLAPALMSILDVNKEMLSKGNLSETDRNSFLATKAQAAGLSASQLETILNSGFFYVPYVEYFSRTSVRGEREVKNDNGKVTGKIQYTDFINQIKVGLLWYKLNVDKSNTTTISFIGIAKGWGDDDPIERTEQKDDNVGKDADWIAFSEAVNVSAVNIGNETKKIEEFKLVGGVSEITTFGIRMTLGNREGVGLDDSYWVEEQEESESGEVSTVQRGFVKVREIGNNKRNVAAMSYAQTITGMGFSPGLKVREIPLLGINGIGGFGRIPVAILGFKSNFGLPKYDFVIHVDGETKDAYGPMASLEMSLANATSISELWFHLGAAVGFLSIPGKLFLPKYDITGSVVGEDTSDINANLTGYINLGLVKKFYFRRFGFFIGSDVKLLLTYITAAGMDQNEKELSYVLLNKQIGFDGRGGLEMYITPELSIGAGVEYTYAGKNNVWSVTVTDVDKNDTKIDEAQGPIINYKGISWFGWINYSLPSLD